MPPYLIARTEQSSSDPIQISGFYGPGAWAAWVITLIASWIPLLQGDYTHNLHFIGYAIYTNWAAIDLIHHVSQVPPQDQQNWSDADKARLDNIAASLAVLQIGICQMITQMCFFTGQHQHEESARPKLSLEARRRLVLTAGAVFPLSMVFYVPRFGFLFQSLSLVVFIVGGIMGFCVVTFNVCRLFWSCAYIWDFVLEEYPFSPIFFILCLCSLIFIIFFGSSSQREDLRLVHTRDILPPKRCYFVPCAPQGIGEWDQAFSLLVAIFLFLYEFGYRMVHVARNPIQTVRETWPRVVRWFV